MIFYLYRHLVVAWVAITPLVGFGPAVYGASIPEALSPALAWSGPFAALYVYLRFRRKKIWPLYRNLRHPVFVLLGAFAALAGLAGLLLRLAVP